VAEHEWYYVRSGLITNDEQIGPVPEKEFTSMLADGKIKPATSIASQTRTKGQWVEMQSVPSCLKIWKAGEEKRAQLKAAKQKAAADAKAVVAAERQQQAIVKQAEQEQLRQEVSNQQEQQWEFVRSISDSTNVAQVLKMHHEASQILTSNEQIEYVAIQQKPVAVKADVMIITNRRLIFYRPKLLGRMDFQDYLWRDLYNAHLKNDMIGSTFSAQHISGGIVTMDYLPKNAAARVYRIAQQREEEAIEIRRQREMEERRAGAMNIAVQAAPVPTSPVEAAPVEASPVPTDDPMERLAKLKKMLDAELITQEDYDLRKAEILKEI